MIELVPSQSASPVEGKNPEARWDQSHVGYVWKGSGDLAIRT